MNVALIASIQGAVAEALTNCEPRIKLTRVIVNGVDSGVLNLVIEGFHDQFFVSWWNDNIDIACHYFFLVALTISRIAGCLSRRSGEIT